MSSLGKNYQEVTYEKESADYFFHYTNKLDHLVSIMNNYFMPFYCMESLEFLGMPELKIKGMAYPVVCFCDLPLSRHKVHKSKFGEYGIGLKKKWGINNFLTSLVYTHPESITAEILRSLFKLGKPIEKKLTENELFEFKKAVSLLMMHYKPFEGHQYIKGDKLFDEKVTCFYDEREWRYIPLNGNHEHRFHLEMHEYLDTNILNEESEKIQKENRLEFKLNDIEFLFLKDKDEIEPFLSQIRPRYSEEEIKDITKKIQPI